MNEWQFPDWSIYAVTGILAAASLAVRFWDRRKR